MRRWRGALRLLGAAVIAMVAGSASADDLSNQSFKIQYDAQGIRSLKRTNDVHDTDYIQANGALGRLLIRYRTTANGDWRELRELLLRPRPDRARRSPTCSARCSRRWRRKSTPSAAVGVAGLRGLNDGQVPLAPAPGGRAPAAAAARHQASPERPTRQCSPGRDPAARRSGCSTRFPITKRSQGRRVLGVGERQRGGAWCDDGAAIVARALSGRRSVEARERQGRVRRRGQRVDDRRVRTRQDDGACGSRSRWPATRPSASPSGASAPTRGWRRPTTSRRSRRSP